ncbi:MAG: DNA/RNA helicase domain-containing protein [Candidatus Paceibacterota bacterium]
MSQIKSFKFDKNSFNEIRAYRFGKNWPVVYVLENGKDVYVGQAINAHRRLKQHNENTEKQILKLKTAHILSDDEFNVSAALDIESWLIQYMSADQVFTLHNKNGGLKNHNYYDRPKYKAKFEDIWKQFLEMGIAKSTLEDLKNTDLFKYSPYKSLTEDQLFVARKIFKDLKFGKSQSYIVNGRPGTGKTILATYLFKFLKEQDETKNLKMVLVVPMTSLRTTIKKVFGKIKGLSSSMVIGPNDVARGIYDLIIVDEAHRLQRRKNIMGMGAYDQVNTRLGLPKEATNLDWIMKCSKNQIFFYDENQSIKPADVRKEDFKKLNAQYYTLSTQMRVEAGEEYIEFIEALFDLQKPIKTNFENYDFKIYDNVEEMVSAIREKDKKHGLSRVVAGYAWPWHTKSGSKSKQKYDIEIGNYKGIWNSTATDWVNSPNAINEVGCIHTVQGYDLNYIGVIIGPEFGYDIENKKFFVDREKYLDRNGRAGIQDPKELDGYIKNIYKTILTRGIKGTYVYIVDENLRKYFKEKLRESKEDDIKLDLNELYGGKEVVSPFTTEMISVPLVGSAPCGNPLLGEENIEEYIEVEKNKIKPGAKYFIVRAEGDSMNKAGINDQDLVLCRFSEKGETGDRVVALLQGENVTIKYYDKKDGRRILLPKSTNPEHQPIIPQEGDVVQGIVQEVLK